MKTNGPSLLAALIGGIALCSAAPSEAVVGGSWVAQGPGPTQRDTGAVKCLAPHPSDASILYAGAVNGGVWKTTNATSAFPHWVPLTDDHPSLSISSLTFDPTDGTHQTLVAGIGSYSSYARIGGARMGLMRTTDGGATWADLTYLRGMLVSGVAGRGSTIVAAIEAGIFGCPDVGIYRSTDTGTTFTRTLKGFAYDLASDPANPNTLYTALPGTGCSSFYGIAPEGIYKSTDAGSTWTRVSTATVNNAAYSACNLKVAVGNANNVNVVISGFDGFNCHITNVFRSGDGGTTWTQMDQPAAPAGINPEGFGNTMLSIAADPTNANLVYVGGDNSGIYRGDASLPPGSQWARTFYEGSASFTAAHVDSRHLIVDAGGDLLEADDGGPYRRPSPQSSAGNWISLANDLQSTELHDIAYDTVSDIIFGGAQDNGPMEQTAPDATAWSIISAGDGGDVAFAFGDIPGQSVRYDSIQYLASFRRLVYGGGGFPVSTTFPSLIVVGGGAPLQPQFRTPIGVNRFDPSRIVFGGLNSIYESFDGGNTLHEIGPGYGSNDRSQNAIAYGGRRGGVDNPDVLYVGTASGVGVRTSAGGAFTASSYGGPPAAIALDPNDWAHAFAIALPGGVSETTDAGATWTSATGNLSALTFGFLSAVYIPATPYDMLVVGTMRGVFVSFSNDFSVWDRLGSNLPNAPAFDLFYDPYDDLLVAGTLGRGAWKLTNIGGSPPPSTTTTSTTTSTTTTTTLPSCPPSPASCQGAPSQAALLALKDATPDAGDKLSWKWKSTLPIQPSDFGNPQATTHYVLCVYDAGGLKLQAVAPAGGLCGTKRCWTANAKGFKYGNKVADPDGLLKITLVAGAAGSAKIGVKGKGMNLAMPALPLSPPVRVQLGQSASSTCWEASHTAAPIRNDATQFKAKSD